MINKVAFIYLTQEGSDFSSSNDDPNSKCSRPGYLVTNSPGYDIQRRPQLGLQYLCAILEKQGIKTNIFDQTVEPFGLKILIEKLKEFDMAGFYCSDTQENRVKAYCNKIKQEINIPLLVGGPSTCTNPSFLNYGCDIVVHGEGEITIQQIVEYYNGKITIDDVKGISYKKNREIIRTIEQKLIQNLDEIPFPDRSKIYINAYYDFFLFGMKKPYITMITSRGCPHRCYFCTSCKMWGYKYRRRSVDNTIAEIDDAVKRYNVKYVAFQDDVFGISNDWIEEFCEQLLKKDYSVKWMAILHPFSIGKDKKRVLNLMKRAGCDTLSFGLQSAHPDILKGINRNPLEPEKLKDTIEVGNRLGFVTAVSYIFGLPGDTRETIQKTIDYSLKCGATLSNYYVLTVLKGSELELMYANKTICDLSNDEIVKLTTLASRKFYTSPTILLRISLFIVRNPRWIIAVGLKIPSVLARIGFLKIRKE